ncbi:Uncharacterized protein Fot_42119 [Forsythia ovata]|uniref:Uncharacterized protein n=1 Tax=Forsythia ovata TaxID=205694 RepID=A0ABD1RLR7_9LAMI
MVGEAYPRMLKWESDVHVTSPFEGFLYSYRFNLTEKGNEFWLIKLTMKVVGGEEPKKYLLEETFVSKRMFDVLNFCPSFDLGIDDEHNANDIELDDMEFIEHDLKMIDKCVQMRNMSTSKNEENVDADDNYILVDDSTSDILRKKLRKAAAVSKKPLILEMRSNFRWYHQIATRVLKVSRFCLKRHINSDTTFHSK